MATHPSEFKGVIWGLGNPGDKYAGTRHNLGAMAVELLARRGGQAVREPRGPARAWLLPEGSATFLLLSNTVFVNESGMVAKFLADWGFEAAKVLVLVDDLSLPFGSLRLRDSGSAGSHNGLKDIEKVWAQAYPRLRLGIGPGGTTSLPNLPPEGGGVPGDEWRDYVLSRFAKDEEQTMPEFLEAAGKAALDFFHLGFPKARDTWNRRGLPTKG